MARALRAIATGVALIAVGMTLWGAGSLLVVPAYALVLSFWAVVLIAVGFRWLIVRVLAPTGTVLRRLGPLAWNAIKSDPVGARADLLMKRISRRMTPLRPISNWLAARVRPGRGGLARTFAALTAVAAGLALWRLHHLTGISDSFVVAFDERVADLAASLSDSTERAVMLGLTTAGTTPFMTTATLLMTSGMFAAGRRRAAGVIVAITGGSALMVTILKAAVSRVRPDVGLLVEASSSWPSGHASAGLALALAVVAAWRLADRPSWRRLAIWGVPIGLLIGYSRVYLGIHWASDVVAGWLVASLVTALVVLALDFLPPVGQRITTPRRGWQTAGALSALAVLLIAGLSGSSSRLPTIEPPPPTVLGHDWPAETTGRWPVFSETLTGRNMEPIGIIVAADEATIRAAVAEAGWFVANEPSIRTLARAYWAGIRGKDDPTAPVTPTFLNARVHDVAIERSAGDVRRRHHARFWRTDLQTSEGCPVWFATASFDDSAEWSWRTVIPNHHIAPAIDEEQAYLVDELVATGLIAEEGQVRVTEPTLGTNAAGDPWFTFGMASVLVTTGSC